MLPIIIILISLYLLGVNFYNRIDRVDDIKDAVPQSVEADASDAFSDEDEDTDKLNINSASAEEFESLEGIGNKLAERIIEKRESLGGFSYIEQLMDVEGIGSNTFEKIKNHITVE